MSMYQLPDELERRLGAPLLGTIVAAALWGLATCSTWLYYEQFPNDRWEWKALVAVVAICDTMDIAFVVASMYYRFIINFGDPLGQLRLDWRIQAHLPLLAIITLLVQAWFAHRLYRLFNRSIWLPGLIVLCGILTFAFSIVFTCRNTRQDLFIRNVLVDTDWSFSLSQAFPAAGDFLITGGMVFWLWQQGKKAEFASTRRILRHYLSLALSTNALTAIVCIICFGVYKARMPYYGAPFTFVASHLYLLTLTVALNARGHFTDLGNATRSRSTSVGKTSNVTYTISTERASAFVAPDHELRSFSSQLRTPTSAHYPSFAIKSTKSESEEKTEPETLTA